MRSWYLWQLLVTFQTSTKEPRLDTRKPWCEPCAWRSRLHSVFKERGGGKPGAPRSVRDSTSPGADGRLGRCCGPWPRRGAQAPPGGGARPRESSCAGRRGGWAPRASFILPLGSPGRRLRNEPCAGEGGSSARREDAGSGADASNRGADLGARAPHLLPKSPGSPDGGP